MLAVQFHPHGIERMNERGATRKEVLLRGLLTLQVRMERIAASTEKVVDFQAKHPTIEHVYYAFSASNPQQELAQKQMAKGGGQFSAVVKADSIDQIETFCNKLQRFLLACSWGGHESLVLPTCALRTPLTMTFRVFPGT